MDEADEKKANTAIVNERRKQTRQATIDRHASMRCFTRDLSINLNSQRKRDWINRLFLESKWLYNAYLAQRKEEGKFKNIDTKNTVIPVKVGDRFEDRWIVNVSSQVRQQILTRIKTNMRSAYSNYESGNIKSYDMKFITACNSVPLKAGRWMDDDDKTAVTFKINRKKNRIKLQGCPFLIRINGGKQIPDDAEIASGNIVRRRDGRLYLQVTYFVPFEDDEDSRERDFYDSVDGLDGVGLDFGIKHNVTLSDGRTFDWCFEDSDAYKDAQRRNQLFRERHRCKYGWAVQGQAPAPLLLAPRPAPRPARRGGGNPRDIRLRCDRPRPEAPQRRPRSRPRHDRCAVDAHGHHSRHDCEERADEVRERVDEGAGTRAGDAAQRMHQALRPVLRQIPDA